MKDKTKTNNFIKQAFIRVNVSNQTQNGLVEFSEEHFKMILDYFTFRYPRTQYFWILHDKDTNSDGLIVPHYHLVLIFDSPLQFQNIKDYFPYGYIRVAYYLNACIQYLTHINQHDKAQYKKEDIHKNVSNETLEYYLTTADEPKKKRKQ